MKKNLYSHKITYLVTGIGFALLPMEYTEATNTQIQTDSTLSGISAINIDSQSGNQIYTLSEINGKTVGSNLFYSFSNFSIGATDTAWFNLNTPDLANVISRVTGGAESIIDGHLQMTNVGSAPSFFFINPAGVTFSAGASVDVPGSFYVSTASGLNMSDGSVYAAHEVQASTLSAAEPESFGFLGNESGSINLSGLETDNVELTFKPGTDVGLIGNNVHIKNSHISSTALADGDLTQEGLNIQIAATGEESVNFNFANRNTQGNLIIECSHIEASGNGAGFLGIRAGGFKATDSFLFVDNTGEIPMTADHGVDVFVRSLLVLDHSIISSDALGNSSDPDTAMKGNAGSVIVRADSIEMLNGGNISSSSSADGNAGQVDVVANTIRIDGIGTYFDNNDNPVEIRSGVSSSSQLGASGKAGIVLVAARDSLIMSNAGAIESDSRSSGAAGDVIVEAGQITISDNAFISSDALSTGGSGTVRVIATDINIVGTGNKNALTGISSTSGSDSQNNIGIVMVKAESLSIVNGGTINTSTASSEEGGSLGITVSANHINLDSGGSISSSTFGNADAGVVAILGRESDLDNGIFTDAESITITNGGFIDSSTIGGGSANLVHVQAEQIKIDGQGKLTGIFSDAEDGSSGNAFGVSLVADSLQLTNGGEVRSLTFGSGNAGAIAVDADFIHIDGENNSSLATGIFSSSESLASGSAGRIDVIADSLDVINGGTINTSTVGPETGDFPGFIIVSANHINLDNGGSILSSTFGNADAGGVAISGRESDFVNGIFTDAESITITNGGFVDSSAFGSGNAGSLLLQAKAITIDGQGRSSSETGVYSKSVSTAAGSAGRIDVIADSLDVINGGTINTETVGSETGDFPGFITVSANHINLDSGGNISSSTSGNADAGGVAILGRESNFDNRIFTDVESITITNGGLIDSSTIGDGHGNAGLIHVQAKQITIDGQGETESATGIVSRSESREEGKFESNGIAGRIDVFADSVVLRNNGQISNSTQARSNGDFLSDVVINANNINLDSGGRISSSTSGNADAGGVAILGRESNFDNRIFTDAESITITNGGFIDSSTSGSGNAGSLLLQAKAITIDGQRRSSSETGFNNDNPVEIRSGVSSSSQLGASGNAGIVLVAARDSLIMSNAGAIESDSHSSGAAGDVIVEAGQITISDNAFISSDALSIGGSGTVQVIATDINIVGTGNKNALTGISSTSGSDSQNNIGIVMVKAESLSIVNGGTINTSTASSEEGGSLGITVSANHINLDSGGNISSSTSGNADAGVIEVTTDSLNLINTGSISTLTSGQGDAGFVTINARTIEIDGQNNKSNELTGITSSAQLGESKDFTEIGSAGVITIAGIGHTDSNPVLAETLHIKNRGGIVSFTEALNPADYIGAIKISAENIYIETEGSINTSSSGINNAGIIEVNFQEMLFLGSSSKISTEANQGNGGDITISGGGIVYLRDSAITTSVSGQEGNGGDINISANSLIMDSGFIQANTAAVGASGGDVNIKVPVLVPSGGFLQTGGNTPFEFQPFSGINVIQAAAPDGVSGAITAASPQLNLSGVLTNLVIESFDSSTLSQNMCTVEQGSSLYQSGKGGLRMRARDFLLLPVF